MRWSLDFARLRLGTAWSLAPHAARLRAVAMCRVFRPELRPTVQARTISDFDRVLAAAVRFECRCAVGTYDSEVLESVVVADPIDVVDDQRHPAAAPHLVLTAQFATARLQSRLVQPILQLAARVRGSFDEYFLERIRFVAGVTPPGPVRVELGCRNAVVRDELAQRVKVAARRS